MALTVHGAVGASGPAGGLPLLLLPDQAPDDQRYDDDQSHTNQMVPTFSLIHCSMETHSFSDILGTFKMLAAFSDMGSKGRRGSHLPKGGGADAGALRIHVKGWDKVLTPWR